MAGRDQESDPFRPRVRAPKRAPTERVPGFRQSVLARAEQRFTRLSGAGHPPMKKPRSAGPAADVPAPGPGSRRCVIKARVVQMRARGAAAARLHLDYIERDGVEEDGSPGRLYSARTGDVRPQLIADAAAEAHQFRFIVSPEDGADVDLTAFTRDLMAQMERDTGRRLVWGAVNHHDTDNPHVHIVLRGVDAAGAPLRIERAYISERMRWQAQHLVTRELGQRTDLDIARQLNREVRQERFTGLDRRLAQVMSRDRFVDTRRLSLTLDRTTRARFIARLTILTQFGLATKPTSGTWQLVEGWETGLRALGDRGDIIKRMHAALGRQPAPGQLSIVEGSSAQPIEGIVRRKGLHDELTGELYAVVETLNGRAHYLRVEADVAESFREGQLVRVEVAAERWAKRMDQAIQAVAREHQGVYDPARHQAQLATNAISISGEKVTPEAVVAANVRRLERLERYRLVSRAPGGRWNVPSDLVALLTERERSHPRIRTSVTVLSDEPVGEVRHVRPTWLDQQAAADPTRAGYGFGAQVAAATRERAQVLAHLGIAGPGAEQRAELQRRVKLSLGSDLARAMNGTFLPEPPPGFRGRVAPCQASPPGGQQYLQIVDEPSRRLTLVAAADLPPGLEGQVVELRRDSTGRIVARSPELLRGV